MAAEAPRSVVETEEAAESTVEAVAAQLAVAAGPDAPNRGNGRDPLAVASPPGGASANGSAPRMAPTDPAADADGPAGGIAGPAGGTAGPAGGTAGPAGAPPGRPAAPTSRPGGPTDPGRPRPSAASWPTAPPDPC